MKPNEQPAPEWAYWTLAGMYVLALWALASIAGSAGRFGLSALLWLGWGALTLVIGSNQRDGTSGGGRVLANVAGLIGVVVAVAGGAGSVLPAMFILLGASNMKMRTMKDFHSSSVAILLLVGALIGMSGANWTAWIYLAPFCVLGAAGMCLGHLQELTLRTRHRVLPAIGFSALAMSLGLVLFLVLPRPSNLGFGFLAEGEGGYKAITGQDFPGRLSQMFGHMLTPEFPAGAPELQRAITRAIVKAAAVLASALDRLAGISLLLLTVLLVLTLIAMCLWKARHWRHWIGSAALAWVARSLVKKRPDLSVRYSVEAIEMHLRRKGFKRPPWVSMQAHLLRHFQSSPGQEWASRLLDIHGAARFGRTAGTEVDARQALDLQAFLRELTYVRGERGYGSPAAQGQ